MPDDAADFDDEQDPVEGCGALLPQDDRIWRHPSEVGSAAQMPAGSRSRNALLPGTPARPGSWTAGIAGALLATGIVLVATHMAGSSGRASASSHEAGLAARTGTTLASVSELHGLQAAGETTLVTQGVVGSQLASAAAHVYQATVLVTATRGATTTDGAGLVIGSDCLVVAPAHLAQPGASIDLTLPDGKLVAAQVLGVDTATGVAVLRCTVTDLASVPDDVAAPAEHELVALVFTAPHAIGMSVGLVTAVEQRVATGTGTLLDELETDIPQSADGAALIDGDGAVLGVVVGNLPGGSLVTPTWLAMAVARRIADGSRAARAWLGIAGTSVVERGQADGVRVDEVVASGAAARAGIRVGDVVQSVAGRGTDSIAALQAQLYTLQPGASVAVSLLRDGRSVTEHATLATAPAA